MSQNVETPVDSFVDRRDHIIREQSPVCERRQFVDSREDLSPEARELARAVDEYKLRHRRRFITYEEIVSVMTSLGYHK